MDLNFLQSDKERLMNNYMLNFGPQHPAAHGVLRIVLEMDGEVIEQAEPHVGMLHRGTEKLIEYKNYLQALPYFDRLDYMAMLCQEHCYVLCVEKLLGIKPSRSAQYLRVLFAELTRIFNHVVGLTAHAMDVGALTPFLWNFEEREKIMEFFERISGARMHSVYFTPGGVVRDIDESLFEDLRRFFVGFNFRLDELEEMLTENRIWKQRTVDVGVVTKSDALLWGFSGPMLRASGVAWDIRKVSPYDAYDSVDFLVPVGEFGDSFDRFLVRIEEMRQSVSIGFQCLDYLGSTGVSLNENRVEMDNSMELLIEHFKNWSSCDLYNFSGEVYQVVEAPKGEFGCFLSSFDGLSKPYRCHIKAPGFLHLQAVNSMARGHLLADLVTIIGSQDIVFGEIDR